MNWSNRFNGQADNSVSGPDYHWKVRMRSVVRQLDELTQETIVDRETREDLSVLGICQVNGEMRLEVMRDTPEHQRDRYPEFLDIEEVEAV
jgi:hypothetical protein